MRIWRMKRDEMHAKEVAARRVEKARIKQLKELQKNINIISDEMFQSISDLEIEWKTTNLIWLTQQAVKQNKKKKSRVNDNRDDEEMKFMINRSSSQQSWKQVDFVSFEDDEDENARYARYARQARQARYDLAEHDIDQKFLLEDFFDDMYDN